MLCHPFYTNQHQVFTKLKRLFVVTSFLTCFLSAPAFATAPALSIPTGDSASAPVKEDDDDDYGAFNFMSGISRSSSALGSMWGLRPWLSQYGLSFGLQETSEVLGNVSGGMNRGFDYDGLTQMALQLDTRRAFGFYGGTLNISALQIHGRNLSADNLGTLQTASGIEADRATRLWELWYDQKFLNEDRLDVKIGQQSIDQEFITSQNAALFVNTMFGWPMVPSADMPSGGPAYPLSALGVRMEGKPTNSLTLLGGLYNGNPTPINSDGSQEANGGGTAFPLDGGVLAIAEIQYAYPALGSMVDADESEPLARVYKLGIWYDTENFADQELDNTGVSLATSTTGIPQQHHGNYSIYAVADQMIWHSKVDPDRAVNFFTRLMGTPQTDRNLIDFSANAGFTISEPFLHRDDDTFGIAMGYAHVSSRVAALDQDTIAATNTYTPVRSSETFVEATYKYQVTPWWQVQPDLQYVFNPGGVVVNPNTGTRVKNEAVMGVRTIIAF